jgi:arylsulfatase A-like enzyme
LRGFKGTLYEGGLRVPGIIEWPAGIEKPRVTRYPAGVVDIFPTLADILGLSPDVMLEPHDGLSLRPLLTEELKQRVKPLPFQYHDGGALVDNRYKVVAPKLPDGPFELYDLETDPRESRDMSAEKPDVAAKLRADLLAFHQSVEASVAGRDYPEGRVDPREPPSMPWPLVARYQSYLEQWRSRPEYRSFIDTPRRPQKKTK